MTGTILEFILLLASHASVGLYSSTLKYSKKTTYLIWGIWVAVQGVMMLYTELVVTQWAVQSFLGFVLPFLGQYVIFFATTKGKVAQRVFTMLTYSVFFCIAITLFLLLKSTYSQLHPMVILLLQGGILFAVVAYFLRFVCPLCRIAEKTITTGWGPLIFVDIVFLVTVMLSALFPDRLTNFYDPGVVNFVFISISIMSVYPVIFANLNSLSEVAEKREMERQNKLLLAQIEAETDQLAADSQARHDRRHHNLVMLEYANNNDIESVREYLKNLVESETAVWGKKRYCENLTVNTVLTVYARKAREHDIGVKITAHVSREAAVLPQDLVIVIANLFENAIHGVQNLESGKRNIKISVKENVHRLLIQVENPCNPNMVFEESHYGVGIHSVIATTNKYDGMYDFSAENGVFAAKISLNLK